MVLYMSATVHSLENLILTPNQRRMCKYKMIPSNMGSLRAANVLKAVASSATAMVISVTCLIMSIVCAISALKEYTYQFCIW